MILLSNRQYVDNMLDVLSSFNYVEVSMIFMRNDMWLESVIWIDLKSLIACYCWDLNYANVDWWIEVLIVYGFTLKAWVKGMLMKLESICILF
jgi:hypothetical protein